MPIAGHPDPGNTPWLLTPFDGCLWSQSGTAAGVVTDPIQKSCLNEAGFGFQDTQNISQNATTMPGGPLMMLACDKLRVVPATVHIPLKEVSNSISTDLIIKKCTLMHHCLQTNFDINTRVASCGLNPHAGEDGKMGEEDSTVIVPAIHQLVSSGINATGPHPADTLFHTKPVKPMMLFWGCIAVSSYPIKNNELFGGVNITFGLDFVRTSPDHTGLDIAGSGVARADNLIAAINMAKD